MNVHTTAEPTGALDGIKILDMTLFLAGPYCTMMLGDQGADVIKVEPLEGDYTRFTNPFRADDTAHQVSGFFASVNRNKRSITVDLKKPAGKELILRIADQSDAVVENFRAGVMDRLGLAYETLIARNPKLVYATIRGFGDPRTGKSPYWNWPAYDVVSQAMGGIMGITGPDENTPMKVGPGVGDTIPAMMCAYGIVCAILRAHRTGKGQFVDVSMVDAILATCERIVHMKAYENKVAKPGGNRHPLFSPFGIVPAKDGYITIAAHSDEWWKVFCDLMQKPEWMTDPILSDRLGRVHNQDYTYEAVGKETSKYTKKELMARLGGKMAFSPVNNIDDIFADPHFEVREMLVDVEHPGCATPVKQTGVPIKMTETPGRIRQRAAILGEHTDQIMAEVGYKESEIAALKRDKVVG